MIAFTYILCLIISIAGLVVIDRRWKLALWVDARRTLKTIALSVGIFIVWDILGIILGIFFHGGSRLTLPIRLGPEFPLEELIFLVLLCYSTLIIYQALGKIWPRI